MMDPSDFLRLLNTDHYAPANLEEVNDLCRNYPEFNLAHMLKVRIRELLGQDKEKELKVAAVYASDRTRLFQLVTGETPDVRAETKGKMESAEDTPIAEDIPIAGEASQAPFEEADEIQFSEEPYVDADVIIEQHAPYAAPEVEEELLELEEDPKRSDSFILDTSQDELSSETLIQVMVKEESDMEEPDTAVRDTPAMDRVEEEEGAPNNDTLIREFIKGDPGPIRADRKTSLKGDVSLASTKEHDGFITDTLAKIYVKQGLVAKAIYAYEKLSLKYPEKSAYFAAQIEKVKNINHS